VHVSLGLSCQYFTAYRRCFLLFELNYAGGSIIPFINAENFLWIGQYFYIPYSKDC